MFHQLSRSVHPFQGKVIFTILPFKFLSVSLPLPFCSIPSIGSPSRY